MKVMKRRAQRGFTLIELMFAMALLGFILIFSLTVISQLISTYNRGLSLVQVNQAIRHFDNDLTKALGSVGAGSVTINFFNAAGDRVADPTDPSVVAGSICLKDSVYVWNLGNAVADDGQPFFGYAGSAAPFRLLRINTNDIGYCEAKVDSERNYRRFPRGQQAMQAAQGTQEATVSLLGSQSMVMYANISTLGNASANQGKLMNVHFVLSSAGADFAPAWVDENGDEKPENAPLDLAVHHLTCVNTRNRSEFCSFGEFNSIIYMRGQ